MSFLGFEEMREGAKQVSENMAGWNKLFYLPTDLPGALDIPIANWVRQAEMRTKARSV